MAEYEWQRIARTVEGQVRSGRIPAHKGSFVVDVCHAATCPEPTFNDEADGVRFVQPANLDQPVRHHDTHPSMRQQIGDYLARYPTPTRLSGQGSPGSPPTQLRPRELPHPLPEPHLRLPAQLGPQP